MSKQRLKEAGLWIFQILMVVGFAGGAGRTKLVNAGREWERTFHNWGYPDHFFQVIGAQEFLGGLALLTPWTVAYGAATLMVVMAGACGHHLFRGEWGGAAFTGALALAFLALAYIRRPAWLRRARNTKEAAAGANAN